jgi:glycosyltransferase involved in cell wall biosynthesis
MISVIVPVYNVESDLKKCVDSIIYQTYSDLEIILVDDGSTDSSGAICDQYAEMDSRIRVLHKFNGGLSDARNFGIGASTGSYIGFVDSDDYIDTNMFEVMYSAAVSKSVDMVICGRRYITDSCTEIQYTCSYPRMLERSEALQTYLRSELMDASVCNKLFKRSLFMEFCFPFGKVHEDIFIMHELIGAAGKVYHVGVPLYNYVQRNGSITKGEFSPKNFDYLEAKEIIYERYKYIPKLDKLAEKNLFEACIAILDKMILQGVAREYPQQRKECIRMIRKSAGAILRNPEISKRFKFKTPIIAISFPLYCYLMLKN